MSKEKENKLVKILKEGGVGVMPTDTLYGLVGSAFSKEAINRIYKIKKRNKNKKLIVLISSLDDLKKFKVVLNQKQKEILNKYWPHSAKVSRSKPDAVSVIINDIAFRLPARNTFINVGGPAKKSLIELLKKTGPLMAPSANPEGQKPAENIKEAKNYFGDMVDFYLSGGTLKGQPSKLIKINKKGEIEILR
jgi:L-threonylcarbamoyladenylate synthase